MAVIDLATDADAGHRLYEAWRYAKAQWEVFDYSPDKAESCVRDEQSSAHCRAACDALNAYLLHPAADLRALALKLRVFRDEEIWDGWTKAEGITIALAADAHRLAFGGEQ